nr:twitch domain-containing radical SAM protein [Bacteriovorax sp. HI3]
MTLDLSRGFTHSCHHPERHQIPLKELEIDAGALHNTVFKMQQRKMMLEGIRPPECEYCWKIEDAPGENISDRFIKSIDHWAFDKLDEALSTSWDKPVNPTYLEVIFSSDCNLNCMYCVSDVSSSIAREMEKFGPYPNLPSEHRMPKHKEIMGDNPYITAFWKWFPEILPTLRVFRITGGEPLLSSNTFRVLEYLENHPNPNLELAINTNLSYSPQLLEKFMAHIKVLLAKKAIGSYTTYTSLDGHGAESAYIRRGLDFERFTKNVNMLFNSLPESRVILMCTFNLLSIGSFERMIHWVDDMKKEGKKVVLDLSYLKDPDYLRANILDESLEAKLIASLELMKTLPSFESYEVKKFERVVNWACSTKNDERNKWLRAHFLQFIQEFDRRFNSNFEETFPEYATFLKICKKADLWMKVNNLY